MSHSYQAFPRTETRRAISHCWPSSHHNTKGDMEEVTGAHGMPVDSAETLEYTVYRPANAGLELYVAI